MIPGGSLARRLIQTRLAAGAKHRASDSTEYNKEIKTEEYFSGIMILENLLRRKIFSLFLTKKITMGISFVDLLRNSRNIHSPEDAM
jgi:hypothetical protein